MSRFHSMCLAAGLTLAAGCEVSEPLAPVTVVQTEIFRPYAEPGAWEGVDEATRREVWERAAGEFVSLRARRDFRALHRLARETHRFFPGERAAWLNLSTALLINGELGRAITAAQGALDPSREEVLAPDPGTQFAAAAWANIATAHLDLNALPEALEAADAAVAADPGFARAHLRRGEVLHLLGRHPEAVESFARALALDPQPPEIVSSDIVTCALAQRAMGDDAAAESTLRGGIASMPHDFGLRYHLALLEHDRRSDLAALFDAQHEILLRADSPYYDRAAALCEQIFLQSDSPDAEMLRRINEARSCTVTGSGERALALFQEVLAGQSSDERSIFVPLMAARLQRGLGRVADAEATYRLVLERDPLFTPAMVELAELAGEAGRPEEAEHWIDAARACDPFSWKLAEYLTVRQARAASASAEPAGP